MYAKLQKKKENSKIAQRRAGVYEYKYISQHVGHAKIAYDWSSPRRLWPPSTCTCSGWGARTSEFRIGESSHARRWEEVVDGLLRHGGVELALDTTLASTLHADGENKEGCSTARRHRAHGSQEAKEQ